MFFAYDEVNGTNFWNPETTARHIEHVSATVQGSTLDVRLAWKDKDGGVVLDETKRVLFGGETDVFWMDHDITLTASTAAIFAYPSGVNFPPYWHARDYGLFAANPFGRKAFDSKAPERVTKLAVGESVRVRFRLAVYAGQVSKARLDRDYASR